MPDIIEDINTWCRASRLFIDGGWPGARHAAAEWMAQIQAPWVTGDTPADLAKIGYHLALLDQRLASLDDADDCEPGQWAVRASACHQRNHRPDQPPHNVPASKGQSGEQYIQRPG